MLHDPPDVSGGIDKAEGYSSAKRIRLQANALLDNFSDVYFQLGVTEPMPFDLSSLLDISHMATFLGGTALGAAGTYMADRFTDQRRKKEAESQERQRYLSLRAQIPEFFRELRDDMNTHRELAIREFVILPNESVIFNHDHPRLEFYESKYPALINHVGLLVDGGFVDVVRSSGTPIYRLRETFVQRLEHDA